MPDSLRMRLGERRGILVKVGRVLPRIPNILRILSATSSCNHDLGAASREAY